ncbi:hypothetical protein FJ251_06440 [bacterium]|nr:hypothetical protein [bacterium]
MTMAAGERVILAGGDGELLPLYERLRGEGLATVVALGSAEAASLTALLAAIGALPLLTPAGSEPVPPADLWVCSPEWRARAGAAPCLDFAAAAERWPQRGGAAPPGSDAPAPASGAAPAPLTGAPYAAFARELQRELQRSQRYHLGFTLSILRVLDAQGRALSEAAFLGEPLRSLPARLGRSSDSWGLSQEGYLLHLAPETLEQASALRRRLEAALLETLAGEPAGPWRVLAGQASYPRDGESAKALVELALQRLRRRGALAESDA